MLLIISPNPVLVTGASFDQQKSVCMALLSQSLVTITGVAGRVIHTSAD